jgi:hypothetical protein
VPVAARMSFKSYRFHLEAGAQIVDRAAL